MGIFSKKETPAVAPKGEVKGRETAPLPRVDNGLHADLAARGQRYIDQVVTKEDEGWHY